MHEAEINQYWLTPGVLETETLFGGTIDRPRKGVLQKIFEEVQVKGMESVWVVMEYGEVAGVEWLRPVFDCKTLSYQTEYSTNYPKFTAQTFSSSENIVNTPNCLHANVPPAVEFIIEAKDISKLSPSLYTRLGIIHVKPELKIEHIFQGSLKRLSTSLT